MRTFPELVDRGAGGLSTDVEKDTDYEYEHGDSKQEHLDEPLGFSKGPKAVKNQR